MNPVTCPACRSLVPTGRFCATCGHQLQVSLEVPSPATVGARDSMEATALVPIEHTQAFATLGSPVQDGSAWADTDAPVSAGAHIDGQTTAPAAWIRRHRTNRTTGIAAITVLLLASAAYGIFGLGAESHTITGDLSLTTSNDLSAGDSCHGTGGFSDITEGTQVIVEDDTGKTLGTSAFGPGTYDGAACVFQFTFTDVPKAPFYRIQQGGNRGVLQYSYAEMVHNDWSVHLTLGDR